MIQNPYDILGVAKGTSIEDCKKAFKRLARKYHPDSPTGDHEKFCQINEAMTMIETGNIPVLTNVMNYAYKKHGLRHSDLMSFKVF